MNWRHRLIKWLALGDMIIMNADYQFGGFRKQNAGQSLITNLDFRGVETAIGIAPHAVGSLNLDCANASIEIEDVHATNCSQHMLFARHCPKISIVAASYHDDGVPSTGPVFRVR